MNLTTPKLLWTVLLTGVLFYSNGKSFAQDNTRQVSTAELVSDYSITNFRILPDGKSIIAGSDMGFVTRFDIKTGKPIWEKKVNTERQDIYSFTISPNGKEIFVSSVIAADGATTDIVVLNADNGEEIRRMTETSLYVEDPLKQEGLDFRYKAKEEYPDYEMAGKSASFTSDGKLLTLFAGAKATNGQFDRCFKLYSSTGQKLWTWQITSKNNDTFRNGLNSSWPLPSIDSDGKGNYYYGDSDGDFYKISEAYILAQEKKLFITDKDPGKKLIERPIQEDVGIRKVIVKANQVYIYYDGSGAPSFVGVYDVIANKLKFPLKEVDAMIDNMEVSKAGWIGLQNMNEFEIYDPFMSRKVYTIPGTRAQFNPADNNQVIFYDRGSITVVELR
jgi:outer membrane protein assembly factor BamB